MSVFIDKGAKIKIQDINFTGNKALSGKKIRKAMSNTPRTTTTTSLLDAQGLPPATANAGEGGGIFEISLRCRAMTLRHLFLRFSIRV